MRTKYFKQFYLSKTIRYVPFDLHFVEARHRYTMVLYFMNAVSYNANTNYIVPELVKTTDLFENTVEDLEKDDLDEIVSSENIIDVLQIKKASWWTIW